MNIIILGGTGFIGRHLCEKLIRAGHRVSVPTRKLESARPIQMLPGLQPLQCNVHNVSELTQALAGHDALVNLVAILHGSPADFEHVHVHLPEKIVAACQATGITKLLHMSSLGAALDAPSHYLRSKGRGEQVLANSGLDVTLLRPSVVFGEGDRLLNVFAKLQSIFPIMPLAAADAQFQPVWVEDVASAAAQLIASNHSQIDSKLSSIYEGIMPKTFEIVGPQVLQLRQLVALAGRCAGAPRPIIALPAMLARLQAWLMQRLPGPTLMSSDNLDSMQTPNIASGLLPGLRELGMEAASLEAIAPSYLKPSRPLDQLRQRASR